MENERTHASMKGDDDEREEEEIRREAWELAEEKMQESFGADPETDYYFDAL